MVKAFDSPAELAALDGAVQEFTLRGIEFKAKPVMGGRDFGILGAAGTIGEGDMFENVTGAIRRTLLPEYREQWDALLKDSQEFDIPISFKTLADIGAFLMEGATGRPTQPLSPSGTSGERTGTESTDGSGSTAGRVLPTSIREPV